MRRISPRNGISSSIMPANVLSARAVAQTEQNNWLCRREVAAQLGVSPVTVRLWAQEGKLDCSITQVGIDVFGNRMWMLFGIS